MEFYVLHFHSLTTCSTACCLEHDLVVQAQAQLWHAGQVALHFDSAQDLRAQNIAVRGDEQVQRLDYV